MTKYCARFVFALMERLYVSNLAPAVLELSFASEVVLLKDWSKNRHPFRRLTSISIQNCRAELKFHMLNNYDGARTWRIPHDSSYSSQSQGEFLQWQSPGVFEV